MNEKSFVAGRWIALLLGSGFFERLGLVGGFLPVAWMARREPAQAS